MNNNPLEIIDEFLDSENPQVRRNALTALASLYDSGAIKRMVQTALEDKDKSVRIRAENELANLGDQSLALLANEFNIRMEDKNERLPAYALLGRLGARGLQMVLDNLTWLQGLYLEFSLFKIVYPDRNWKFYLRSCVPAFKATSFSLVAYSVVFFLVWHNIVKDLPKTLSLFKSAIENQIFFDMIWYVLWIPPVLVPLITFRASALDLHTDRYKGVLVELVWAGLGGLALAMFHYKSGFYISIILVIMAIRLGCLLSNGVEFDYGPNHLAKTLSGTIAGTLVLLVAAAFDFIGVPWSMNDNWILYMVIIIPGIANSYSMIDTKDASKLHRIEPYSLIAAYGLPVLAISLIALAFFPEPPCIDNYKENTQATAGQTGPMVIKVPQAPLCRSLVVDADQKASINVTSLKSSPYGLRVSGGEKDISTIDNNFYGDEINLGPGSYSLVFARKSSAMLYKKVEPSNAVPILLDHYWNVLGQHGAKLDSPVNININFSSEQPAKN